MGGDAPTPFVHRGAIYGQPPAELAAAGPEAVQLSPLTPGAEEIEGLADATLESIVVAAPPGTLERRYVLAHALRALRPGGALVTLAPKDRGGSRLRKELEAFGCSVQETARRHHRICTVARPDDPVSLDDAIEAGAAQMVPALGLWSQPGVFSWDRLDPGSALLVDQANKWQGRGADFGCGVGILARAVLESPEVTQMTLIDIDRRAVDAAQRNIDDPRATILQSDLRAAPPEVVDLDFVIMNPPFHLGGGEDRGLGDAFVSRAAKALRRGGVCRLVANVALPYESYLARDFSKTTLIDRQGGYKVLEGTR
jgi:16S rRNA (guanine1207-N2)-methyltransferase